MSSIFQSDMFDFGWAGNLMVDVAGSQRAEGALFYILDSQLFAGTPISDAGTYLEHARPSMHDFDVPSYEHLAETEGFITEAFRHIGDAQHIQREAELEVNGQDVTVTVSMGLIEFGENQATLSVLVVNLKNGTDPYALFAGSKVRSGAPTFVLATRTSGLERRSEIASVVTLTELRDFFADTPAD